MVLSNAEPVKAAMKVSGRINEIKPDERMANITHGPLVDIGMPGMTMDFSVDEMLNPSKLPIGTDLTLLLRQNPDFSLTLVGISSEQDVGQ